MRKWIVLGILIGASALLAMACGGGGGAAPAATPTKAPPASTPTRPSEGGGDMVAQGKALFEGTCAACHGMDAKGITGLGKDLTTSEFAKGLSDAELVAFIKKGRDPSDPANTTGVAMPPKGGNPSLSDSDLEAIVAYIRTLEK